MSKRFNSFRPDFYFRTRFREGSYLLASEATEVQLENIQVLRKYMKNTYGDTAFGEGFFLKRTGAAEIELVSGEGIYDGLPFEIDGLEEVRTPGTPLGGKIIQGEGAPTRVATAVAHLGPRWDTSGLADGNQYAVILERKEDLVMASGTESDPSTPNYTSRSTDNFLEGLNVDENTAEKLRPIYIAHFVDLGTLAAATSNALFPQYVNEVEFFVNKGGNTYTASTAIASGTDGQNLTITITDPIGAGGNLGSLATTCADQLAFGKFVDTRGNEFIIVSATISGSDITLTLDSPTIPGMTVPQLVTTVPYFDNGATDTFKIKKADYFTTDNSGNPLGSTYLCVGVFSDNAGSIAAVSLSDEDGGAGYQADTAVAVSGVTNYWGAEAAETSTGVLTGRVVPNKRRDAAGMVSVMDHNWRLSGGGTLGWAPASLTIGASNLYITHPSYSYRAYVQAADVIANIDDGDVLYAIIDRDATADYRVQNVAGGGLYVANYANVPYTEDVVVVAIRTGTTLYFRDNGAFLTGESRALGQMSDLSISVNNAALAAGSPFSTLDFFGAQRDTAFSTMGSPFAASSPAAGQAEIQYGGPQITIGTGEGTAHPTKEWDHRADFEGATHAVFEDALDYIDDLDINGSKEGCTVFIKPGTYAFGAVVQTNNGGTHQLSKIKFIGSGKNTVITRSADISLFQVNSNYVEFENITFEDDGSGTANALLNIDNDNCKITNCNFIDLATNLKAIDCSGDYLSLKDSYFVGAGAGQGKCVYFNGSSYSKVINNSTDTTNYIQMFVEASNLSYSLISNNTVYALSNMLYSGTGVGITDIQIINNEIRSIAAGSAICIEDLNYIDGLSISNNTVAGASAYFVSISDHTAADSAPRNINIHNNIVQSTKGIYFDLDTTVARNIEKISIIGNSIITTSGDTPSIYFYRNGETGGDSCNIYGLQINNNDISSAFHGISLAEEDGPLNSADEYMNMSISNNKIKLNAADDKGIYLNLNQNGGSTTFKNLSIDNNEIYSWNNNNTGIHLECAIDSLVSFYNLSIDDNKMYDVTQGIFITTSVANNSILLQDWSVDNNKIQIKAKTVNANNGIHIKFAAASGGATDYWRLYNGSISKNSITSAATVSGEDLIYVDLNNAEAGNAFEATMENIVISENKLKFNDNDLKGIFFRLDGVATQTDTIQNIKIDNNTIKATLGLIGIEFVGSNLDDSSNISISSNTLKMNNTSGTCHGIKFDTTIATGISADAVLINDNNLNMTASSDASVCYGITINNSSEFQNVVCNNKVSIVGDSNRTAIYNIIINNTNTVTSGNYLYYNKSDSGAHTVVCIYNTLTNSVISNNKIWVYTDGNENNGDSITAIDSDGYNNINGNNIYFNNRAAAGAITSTITGISSAAEDAMTGNVIHFAQVGVAGATHYGWDCAATAGTSYGNVSINAQDGVIHTNRDGGGVAAGDNRVA